MNKIRIKEILIDRAEDLDVEFIDGRIEGDLNKVFWVDLEKIASAISNMVISIGEKATYVFYYTPIKNKAIRVGIKITLTFDSEKIDPKNIEFLIKDFLNQIRRTDPYSADLFIQDQHPFHEEAKAESISFLLKNGGKHIKHPLEVNFDSSSISIIGKFSQIAIPDKLQDDPPATYLGIVDGLIKHSRTVHLKLTTTKILVAYFNHIDFPELHRLLQSEIPHQFVVQQKYDANGRKDMYLIGIETHVDELLNFST